MTCRIPAIHKKSTRGEKRYNTRDSLVIKVHLLVWPSLVYVWESGNGAEFCSGYGHIWQKEAL